jgi:hypothetical protein
MLTESRGTKRSNNMEGNIEPPKKRPNYIRNMPASGDFDLTESVPQAQKSHVVIKMGDHIKPQTDRMNGAKQSRSKRTNWYHPFLWPAIDEAAHKTHWSPTEIEKYLKCLYPKLYNTIRKGTISKWIDKETKRGWSASMKKNIEHRHALARSGQQGILAKHPAVVKEIMTQLQGLRTSGLAVNVLIARSIMLAIIKHRAPDLLLKFKCSEVSFVAFVHCMSPSPFNCFISDLDSPCLM